MNTQRRQLRRITRKLYTYQAGQLSAGQWEYSNSTLTVSYQGHMFRFTWSRSKEIPLFQVIDTKTGKPELILSKYTGNSIYYLSAISETLSPSL